MNDYEFITLARVIHVLAVTIWIGGVAMVTLILIPAIRKLKSVDEQVDTFEQIEGSFAHIAKIMTLLTALSGFYMIYKLDIWNRYLDVQYWWLHAMTLVWFIFSLILFVLEPFILHKIFRKYTEENPKKTFDIMYRLHWILLLLSLITIAGTVAGSHGWFWIKG